MAKDFSLTLDRFSGLHLPAPGEMPISDTSSPDMKNFCITPSGQLKLREGYRVLQKKEGPVRTLWQGALNKQTLHLALVGETLYRSDDAFRTLIPIGTIGGEAAVCCLEFREKLYFLTGDQILCCDGETLEAIQPYRPLIRIASPPSGGGQIFEDVNLLTGKVRQTFSPDGVATSFVLAEDRVESIDYVLRDGKALTEGVDYVADAESGTVRVFGEDGAVATAEGSDNLEIGYTLWDYPKSDVYFCRWGITYGGENDTRAFLYGAPSSPSMRFSSGIANGLPSIAYFPASNCSTVGDGEEITGMVRHYDRQILFTPHATYYSYPETRTEEGGLQYVSFPVYTLSALRGNILRGLSLIVDNRPFSVMPSGLYLWQNTSIRDERNAVCISDRIASALAKEDLKEARCFLRQSTKELYVVLSSGIYVYHYGMDLFYYYEGFEPLVMLEDEHNRFFFGTEDGELCQITGETDDDQGIDAYWESGSLFCSDRTHTKNLFDITLGVSPESVSPFCFSWSTDTARQTGIDVTERKLGKARLFTFAEPNFADFSLETARHRKACRLRVGAKRFAHIRLRLEHPKEERATLGITHLILRGKINDQHT